MKRGGIINARLAGELARLGHTDLFVVCDDAGLPIPSFETVFSGLLEGTRENPEVAEGPGGLLPDPDLVTHQELQRMTAGAKLVVRTGRPRRTRT